MSKLFFPPLDSQFYQVWAFFFFQYKPYFIYIIYFYLLGYTNNWQVMFLFSSLRIDHQCLTTFYNLNLNWHPGR